MSFPFTSQQASDIQALLAQAAIDEQTELLGAYTPVYDYIFEAITDGYGTLFESPKDGVELSVWQWVNGARDVNTGTGFFADFIRDYTKAQYELRYGESLSDTEVQIRSNQIIKAFAEDITNADGLNPNHELPTISDTALHDAGAVASTIFNGTLQGVPDYTANFSPWAGTVSQPPLRSPPVIGTFPAFELHPFVGPSAERNSGLVSFTLLSDHRRRENPALVGIPG
ncbi:MAG: hypothetical protein WBK77_10355 [Alphaproteobacteria bacterium]